MLSRLGWASPLCPCVLRTDGTRFTALHPRRPAVRRAHRLQNLSCLLRKSGDSVA
ncbi:hypothetical protein [Paenibacillus sp. FSL H3-0333]|uniref:hypothetical protein n=1 Tax=Paenibacillus sp. FSL H3-0333 TaxID=2921373 RepID=UPI0030F6AB8E